tara:strand:- start:1339 stop:2244 length:906 start_codon:yes stop_codon:yes gene_type:complete
LEVKKTDKRPIRVLVLGAMGYIGRHICYALKQNGHMVIAVSRGKPVHGYFDSYLSLDLSKINDIELLSKSDFDTVIDLISYIHPNTKPLNTDDIQKALTPYYHMVDHIFRDKKVIFASSGGTIYGDNPEICTESTPRHGLTPYAVQKIMQEDYLSKTIKELYILRISNPYGGSQIVKHGVGFVARVIDCALRNETITLTVPSITTRDYLHINDVTYSLLMFTENSYDQGMYNISTGVGHSLHEIIELASHKLNTKIQYKINLSNYNPEKHIISNVISNKKLTDNTLYKQTVFIEKYDFVTL